MKQNYSMKAPPFEIISIVWGTEYTDLFLNVIVPSYLSNNNLPSCVKAFYITWKIYTTAIDRNRIIKHPHYLSASKYLKIEILNFISPESLQNSTKKHTIKGFCQSHAITQAIANNRVLLLLNPDSVIGDGGIKRCCEEIQNGNQAVLIFELARASSIDFTQEVLDQYFDKATNSLTISNRSLIKYGIRHLIPYAKTSIWEEPYCSSWPSFFYWKASEDNLIGKSLHFHPLALDCRNIKKNLPETLMPDDGGLIEFLEIKKKNIYTVIHSDDIACVELSNPKMFDRAPYPFGKLRTILFFILWSLKYSLASHRMHFNQITLYYQGSTNNDWNASIKKVKRITFCPILLFYIFHPISKQNLAI
ncbi:MAG: hypothetical protein KAR79_06360, partial [Simkaniaceae bacterium]|nr:hypothetical protein [Simkaniaceae bacterium]